MSQITQTTTPGWHWDDYDIVHIGVSGGKDSQAAMTWLVEDSECPKDKIRATFCDTRNEADETYQHVQWMSENIFPIETIAGELGFYELAEKKRRFPGVKARFCTEFLKLRVSQAYLLRLMQEGKRILLITGVRRSESLQRSTLPQFEFDTYYACDVYRPIITWTTAQVFAYLKKKGQPANPLYAYGARRVGCLPCIMSRKAEIRMISERFPERIDRIREWETKIRDGEGSTFFTSGYIPPRMCTGRFVSKGIVYNVPTIDDVVRWSLTARGGKQYVMNLDALELAEAPTCANNSGLCE